MVPSAVVTGSGENAYLCACVDQEANSRPSVGDKQTATTRRGKARRAGRHQFLAVAFPEGSEVDGVDPEAGCAQGGAHFRAALPKRRW